MDFHAVHVHSVPSNLSRVDLMRLARAIRAACNSGIPDHVLGVPLADCLDTAEQASRHGWAVVADSYPTALDAENAAREGSAKCDSGIARFDAGRSEDWVKARTRAARGLTPEQQFAEAAPGVPRLVPKLPPPDPNAVREHAGITVDPYDIPVEAYSTAMVLMANANGNPLVAASQAKMLAHTTDDDDLFRDVVRALLYVFPFLAQAIEQQGLMP